METNKLEKLFDRITASSKIHEGLLYIENASGNFSFCKAYNRDLDTPMLMASITKLLTTACILAMVEEKKIALTDTIAKYLSGEIIHGLHVYHDHEYSFDLTIAHLLFQTSGLPDFFTSSLGKVKNSDFAYTFDDEITWVKAMKLRFVPNTKNKAYYADINFDLLGKVIESVLKCNLQQAYEYYIFSKLNLSHTYLAMHKHDFVPHTYYNSEKLERPFFIRSSFASGGGVTTACELMQFLKVFYNGELFDKTIFLQLKNSHPLQISFYPIRYAGGQMTMTAAFPFRKKVQLHGHSGSTGSFAFYAPEKDIFIVGDLAQLTISATAIRLVMKVALAM